MTNHNFKLKLHDNSTSFFKQTISYSYLSWTKARKRIIESTNFLHLIFHLKKQDNNAKHNVDYTSSTYFFHPFNQKVEYNLNGRRQQQCRPKNNHIITYRWTAHFSFLSTVVTSHGTKLIHIQTYKYHAS